MLTKEKEKPDFEINLKQIYCRLMSRCCMKDEISEIPLERVFDMLQVYFLKININEDNFASVVLDDYLLGRIGVNKEQLQRVAWSNTLRDNPAVFEPLDKVLKNLGARLPEQKNRLYMLSNETNYMGAVCILYPGMLEWIADTLGRDLFVIPSSVHECLIMPFEEGLEAHSIREIVKHVNRTQLKVGDLLSDSLYRYSCDERCLIIDNS